MTEVAFVKNEGRFLLEWLAYHRLIGVGSFLIYSNDCEDDSPVLLDRLTELGIVTHVPNPVGPGEQPQNRALTLAHSHPLVRDADYVLQVDVDEFLCIKAGQGTIGDLIVTAPEADVICVQMRFFGDNGLPRLDDRLVLEALTHASPEDFPFNGIIKSLARNTGIFSKITANHMPAFDEAAPRQPRVFNAGGKELPPESYGRARSNRVPDAYRSMRYAQVNHYAVRTLADYRAKKYRGTAAGNDHKLTMHYWRERNRNDVPDTHIQRHVPAVKRLMEEWLRDPVLAACNRRCFEAYEEILRKSATIFDRNQV